MLAIIFLLYFQSYNQFSQNAINDQIKLDDEVYECYILIVPS